MKTFKYIGSFLLLALFITASMNAANVTTSDTYFAQNHSVKSTATQGSALFIDAETELVLGESSPANLSLFLDLETSKESGLQMRSHKLSSSQNFNFHNRLRDYFGKFYIKEILFPFHSFW